MVGPVGKAAAVHHHREKKDDDKKDDDVIEHKGAAVAVHHRRKYRVYRRPQNSGSDIKQTVPISYFFFF